MSERFHLVFEWCYFAGIALAALLNTLERGWLQSGIGWSTAALCWLFAIARGRRMRRSESAIERVEDICETAIEHYVRDGGQDILAEDVLRALSGDGDE